MEENIMNLEDNNTINHPQLHLGKITWKELSLWFGQSETYFTKHKESREKKLEILSNFADYHIEDKRVYIDKIYIPEYSKALKIIEEDFDKTWNNITRIDTCARVGDAIYKKRKEVSSQIQLSTAKKYTNKVKISKYGRNYKNDFGTQGSSEYVWVEQDGWTPLTEEHHKIFVECCNEAYKTTNTLIAELTDDFKKRNISREEYNQAVGDTVIEQDGYTKLIDLCQERLGFMPEKKTLLRDRSAAQD